MKCLLASLSELGWELFLNMCTHLVHCDWCELLDNLLESALIGRPEDDAVVWWLVSNILNWKSQSLCWYQRLEFYHNIGILDFHLSNTPFFLDLRLRRIELVSELEINIEVWNCHNHDSSILRTLCYRLRWVLFWYDKVNFKCGRLKVKWWSFHLSYARWHSRVLRLLPDCQIRKLYVLNFAKNGVEEKVFALLNKCFGRSEGDMAICQHTCD